MNAEIKNEGNFTSQAERQHCVLRDEIYAAAQRLPAQGPITAFAFLNPLQGLSSLPFDDALRIVKRIYGCEPYLEEGRYRAKLERGRITLLDLRAVISDDLGKDANRNVASLLSLQELLLNLLTHPIHCGVDRELDWLLAESDALRRFRADVAPTTAKALIAVTREWVQGQWQASGQTSKRTPSTKLHPAVKLVLDPLRTSHIDEWSDATWEPVCLQILWGIVSDGIAKVHAPENPVSLIRHRDFLRAVCMTDCDQWVHEMLVRFCAAFLDQGFAHWALPSREKGFLNAFSEHHQQARILTSKWSRGLSKELQRISGSGMSSLDSIEESLQLLGVKDDERPEFIQATLLALRGFSGMIWQTEVRPDRVYISSPPETLVEYLAVRLILDRIAVSYGARTSLGYTGPLAVLRSHLKAQLSRQPEVSAEQQAYIVFQLAQLCEWSPQRMASLTKLDWTDLSTELLRFSSHERRRIYQTAFERQLLNRSLDAISLRASQPPVRPAAPRLQVVCCIDAREESFRRHLEELSDDIETYGTAGFFGVAMYYRGAADAHFAALAPIVMKPKHWVTEEVVYSFEDADRSRAKARRVIGTTSHSLHVGTRGSLAGAFVSTLLGPLATAPLLSRVLFPRLTGVMHRTARQFVAPPAVTRLHLERSIDSPPSDCEEGIGFTVAEMAQLAGVALRDIGLTSKFAKLVIVMGHGSSCLNNPHESAYHCGACAGNPGGPNARALAAMLNDTRVRRILQQEGLEIPEGTYFLGALHNTATEEIAFYDLELLPSAQIAGLRWARQIMGHVAERNAHERARRFESAPLTLTPHDALLHVQSRTEDLAQTRPEYGNSTNAICFVGRRSRIRGLFLDRRSFLMSYDPTQDDLESASLARILSAVVPVCEGINSLYSFSATDPAGWGAGTKLPHNVTSLLGVMDGAASDLRTGIPWQGVDIHEPVRLLFVIEAHPEKLLKIIDANPTLARICRNQWARFATLSPQSKEIHQFVDGEFLPHPCQATVLPEASCSLAWYAGKRDHLPFARIVP